MTLGDLVDKLQELQDAQETLLAAMEALQHGGGRETLERKVSEIEDAKQRISNLRALEIGELK